MSLTLTYGLTYPDFKEANRLFLRYTTHHRYTQWIVTRWINPILGSILVIATVWALVSRVAGFFVPLLLCSIGLLLLLTPVLVQMQWERSFQNQKLALDHVWSVDEQGVSASRIDGSTASTVHWTAIAMAIESPQALVVLNDTHFMFIVPKRVLSPAQLAELEALLRRHVDRFRQVK